MSITVQWILVGLTLAAACAYLLRAFVLRPPGAPADPGCGTCPSCPAVEEMAQRIAEMGEEPAKD